MTEMLQEDRVVVYTPPMTGDDVKRIREGLGMSKLAFGILLGTSYGTVHNWERGRKTPSQPYTKLLRQLEAQLAGK
jgi:DNA-binding transcriptional regulator YiaG